MGGVELDVELGELEVLGDPQRRGLEFQRLLVRLLQRDHFEVVHNPAGAHPRQSDLFAQRASNSYLVEAKWKKRPADISDVDGVRSRLERLEPAVAGVLVSWSGFTATAIADVEERRRQPILLITGDEVQAFVEDPSKVSATLELKRLHLRVHGRMHFGVSDARRQKRTVDEPGTLPSEDTTFLLQDGREVRWLEYGGGYSDVVFVEELPDIDWVPSAGRGVVIDLHLHSPREESVKQILKGLGASGWISQAGRWVIEQSTRSWHGAGATSLCDALNATDERYANLKTVHHTERIVYQDVAEGGFYTLVVDILSSEERWIWSADISLQLRGIPTQMDALSAVIGRLNISKDCYFRPLIDPSVTVHQLPEPLRLDAVGLVIQQGRYELSGQSKWVTGIVALNPYLGQKRKLPGEESACSLELARAELLVCAMRSHHLLDEVQRPYFLTSLEWVHTSDALVVLPVVRWDRARVGERDDRNRSSG